MLLRQISFLSILRNFISRFRITPTSKNSIVNVKSSSSSSSTSPPSTPSSSSSSPTSSPASPSSSSPLSSSLSSSLKDLDDTSIYYSINENSSYNDPTTTLADLFSNKNLSPFAPLSSYSNYPLHLEEIPFNKENQELANMQAPNRPIPWSFSQKSRSDVMIGPRFTQIDFSKQPRPDAAIAFVDSNPIEMVKGRKVSCDGGGPLGHPIVYINLDRPGPMPCMYCGKKFQKIHDSH